MKSNTATKETIKFLHFNDAYHLKEDKIEPVGGCARMKTKIDELRNKNTLVTFGGDLFNPSLLSTVFKGKQMVPVVNSLGVDLAVLGNHDFDFGMSVLDKLLKETKAKWLLSNIEDRESHLSLVHSSIFEIVTLGGWKIGFIGIVEEDWIGTLSFDTRGIKYLDMVEKAKSLCDQLLNEELVDFVVALTHSRHPNDLLLAKSVPQISLILGGHDHDVQNHLVNGIPIVKAGTEFKYLVEVEVTPTKENKPSFSVKMIEINSSISPHVSIQKDIVLHYDNLLKQKLKKKIAVCSQPLYGTSDVLRTTESNLANYICDLTRMELDSEICLLAGGTFRGDIVVEEGDFTLEHLLTVLPFEDIMVNVSLTGKKILDALENGVSKLPAKDGRFPQVSGISFIFDSSLPPLKRIKEVKVNGEPLDLNRSYNVSTKTYMLEGKDGYESLKDPIYNISPENGKLLSSMVHQHLLKIKILNFFVKKKKSSTLLLQKINDKISSPENNKDLNANNVNNNTGLDSEIDEKVLTSHFIHKWRSKKIERKENDNKTQDKELLKPTSEDLYFPLIVSKTEKRIQNLNKN
eukprot:TRINITY_DN55_c0_g1_i2.p1 TRINITY_DN55_c0_g1~~TRINITY_DN55_c0_g1_i2.p1  ORF type:complete len:575 (-),score=202.16 TRINITY_DN55_c0_g1_i2:13-1737(-)